MIVLAGDIGGTKTNIGLFEVRNKRVNSIIEQSYPSSAYLSLADIIEQFLAALEKPLQQQVTQACFGVAGPVENNCCQVTNLPWFVDAQQIEQQFSWQNVKLLNDLEANAWGLAALSDGDFICLNPGQKYLANASIIAAGTGLGQAGLFWDGKRHIPFASEGGHSDFSPATEHEYSLHQYLQEKYQGHVSWERIVSGMGLVNLYQFLCQDRQQQSPSWLQKQMIEADAAAAISKAALATDSTRHDDLCLQALDWFVHFYALEAANQALKIMSRGGVFLGGGIAPKIIKHLQTGSFMKSFVNKGRMQNLLQSMPVNVIMNDKTALYGPAIYAESH